jgi:hypothetical protein
VWLFAKYRLTSGTLWEHATMSNASGSHTAPAGGQISTVSDGKGVFLYRGADGFGNNDFNNLQMLWEYGLDGLADNDSVEICVFAVEMVYIPQGGFTLGDGNGATHSTNAFEIGITNTFATISSSKVNSVQTTSIDAVPLTAPGIGIDGDGGLDLNNDGLVDQTLPKLNEQALKSYIHVPHILLEFALIGERSNAYPLLRCPNIQYDKVQNHETFVSYLLDEIYRQYVD